MFALFQLIVYTSKNLDINLFIICGSYSYSYFDSRSLVRCFLFSSFDLDTLKASIRRICICLDSIAQKVFPM